jgi:hypothetical protein
LAGFEFLLIRSPSLISRRFKLCLKVKSLDSQHLAINMRIFMIIVYEP